MMSKSLCMERINKFFNEREFWTTEEIYERLCSDVGMVHSKKTIQSLLRKQYTNVNKGKYKLALWRR